MTARFDSTCPRCHSAIRAGQDEITRPAGARYYVHTRCPMTVRQANAAGTPVVRGSLLTMPGTAPVAPRRLDMSDRGVYVTVDFDVYRVREAKTNPGHVYADAWHVIGGTRATDAGTVERGEYRYSDEHGNRYSARVAAMLTDGDLRKMTADEALRFSVRYGVCARCGAGLKASDSVYAGMGKTCAQYFPGIDYKARANANRATLAAQVAAPVPTDKAARYAEIFGDDDEPAEQFTADGAPVHAALATATDFPQAARRDARLKALRRDAVRSRWSRAGDDTLEQAAF